MKWSERLRSQKEIMRQINPMRCIPDDQDAYFTLLCSCWKILLHSLAGSVLNWARLNRGQQAYPWFVLIVWECVGVLRRSWLLTKKISTSNIWKFRLLRIRYRRGLKTSKLSTKAHDCCLSYTHLQNGGGLWLEDSVVDATDFDATGVRCGLFGLV